MYLFTDVANVGGFSGAYINPAKSGLKIQSAESHGKTLSFAFDSCRIDDRSFIVFLEMLLHGDLASQIASVEILSASQMPLAVASSMSSSSYPLVYKRLPFLLSDNQPESGAYTFILDLKEPLNEENCFSLQYGLNQWSDLILSGGFALAPNVPDDNYVEPDHEVTSFDSTVEWSIFKLRADPASIGALLNIFTWFSETKQVIVSVTIQ
jgi:hypothetical protein